MNATIHSQTQGLRVASVIFGLMALAQLGRIAMRPEVIVAGHSVPLWPSMVAVILLAGLSAWLWKLTRSGNP